MVVIKKVTLLIPCYNEEQGIREVLGSLDIAYLADKGFDVTPVVIDNNSSDNTAAVARSLGAHVISEPQQGKGHAVITGFKHVPQDADYVVMIDGDATYKIKELPRLLEPLESQFCDVIVGTRMNGKQAADSMTSFNRTGNWVFTFLARIGYKTNVTDVCSGYIAWQKYVVDNLVDHLESRSFAIEMEMITKMAKMNYTCYSVPVTYDPRSGQSHLRPLQDGLLILSAWVKHLGWRPSERVLEKKPALTDDSVKV